VSKYHISKKARIDKTVIIGPYSIIEQDVTIGPQTVIGSYVLIKSGTRIGKKNMIYSGAQIGIEPQDYHFKGESSQCIIGDNNIIREYATISRATGEGHKTTTGNNNFIMTYVHIAHNVEIGNNTIISSGSQLGGWCRVDDFATIGGLCGIHQFCRIGRYAMLGAKSYLNKDLPPYLLAQGNRAKLYGVNTKGLRNHQFTWQEIEEVKDIFRIMSNPFYNLTACLKILRKKRATNKYIDEIIKFIETSRRGIVTR